ncbi:hypothetical protein RUND412_005850 [Rhizina undulata]
MGFLGFGSSSSSTKTAESSTPIAPNRSQRALCWEARDNFFKCLDQNEIVDSIKEAKAAREKCGNQEAVFEKECVGSWVEYFKKRRVMEHNREKMLENLKAEGAQSMPSPTPVGSAQMGTKS